MGHHPTVDKDHDFDHSLTEANKQQGASRGNVMPLKAQYRLLVLATVILTLVVIVYMFWMRKS